MGASLKVPTPLARKGKPRHGGKNAGAWMCAVCFYAETPSSCRVCGMCGANNPADRANAIMRECPNCTFLNGESAEACEMCGQRLRRAKELD